MKTYEIKYEPITIGEITKDKYNIYYYINGIVETKEFFAYDINVPLTEIKQGYTAL